MLRERQTRWRCGWLTQTFDAVVRQGAGAARLVEWFDMGAPGTFMADPFGLAVDGHFHVFVEFFDYNGHSGVIDQLVFDTSRTLVHRATCLTEDWHLSYPQVFAAEGQRWMLPEASESGGLNLYRARTADMTSWACETRIALDVVPVDATPLFYEGRWWLFYSPFGGRKVRLGHLHVAWADRLTGPWHPHPLNPVRVDLASARPGGTARVIDGRIVLPTQDGRITYGEAVNFLWIDRLDPQGFEAQVGMRLDRRDAEDGYRDGLHTVSECGPHTLIDVRIDDRSAGAWWWDLKRSLRRAVA